MSCEGLASSCRFWLRYADDVKFKGFWVKLVKFHEVKEGARVDALAHRFTARDHLV